MFLKVVPAARLLLCGTFAWMLSACGGGGSTTTSLPTTPLNTPTPVPASPTPSPSPYPGTQGDTFNYTGTMTQQFTRFGTPAPVPTDGSSPQPTSTPWTGSTNNTVTQTVTIKTGAQFNGASGLTEVDTHESDQGDHMVQYTIDSQRYLSMAADSSRSNGMDLTMVGLKTSDSSGVSTTTTTGAGNGVLDELPQVPQAQWTNSAARTYVENDSSGITIDNAYNADGSYTGSVQFPQGGSSQVTENNDGSGLYVFPLLGAPTPSQLSFSAVDATSSITIGFQDNADAPLTLYATFPSWFPSVPPVLASDTFVDYGQSALPGSCNVGANMPKQATRIDETRVQLDTVFGEIDTNTTSSYVAGPYGAICTVVKDKLVYYYDFTGQSAFLNQFANVPIQETDTSETLAMQSATIAAASTARRTASSTLGGYAGFASPSFLHAQLALAKRHIAAVKHLNALHRKSL
jgi:hypothetical protein